MGEWPSRWGSFAEGFTGSIRLGSAIRAQTAQQEQQQEQLKMQKETNALQQEHMNLVNDASKFDAALKVIEKSPDIAATQDYISKISLKNPFYKDTLSAYAIADSSTKKELRDFSEGISKLITTPSPDAFSKAELKLAEAGARFGADSNTYKSLKATLDIMKDAYGRDVTPKLVQQIDLGWQTIQKLGKEQPPSKGLLQQQPGISDEELNAVNGFKTNLAELSRWNKDEYDRIVGQYGLNKPAEEKEPGSDFKLFYQTNKKAGKSDAWISNEWLKRQERLKQVAPPIIVNVPGYQTPEGQPVNLNLRTGGMQPAKGNVAMQPKPSEADITFGRTYTSVISLIDGLEQKFKSIESHMAKDATERILKAPLLKTQQFLQTNPDIASTNAFSEATLSKIIRALGEVGTLTDRDVDRARKAIPQITDTIPVKDQKLEQLRGLVTEIYERGKRQPNVLQNPSLGKSSQKGNITKSGNRFTVEEIK